MKSVLSKGLSLIFLGGVFIWSAACNKSSSGLSLGTDTGNAIGATDTLRDEAQEAVLGAVGENQIGTSVSSLSYGYTGLRAAQLFPNSYLRATRADPNCPVIERTVSGNEVAISRTYTECRPFSGLRLVFDGTENVEITRSGGDDSESATISRTGSILRDLEITNPAGQMLSIDAAHEFSATGSFPNFTYSLDLDVDRRFENARGVALADYEITGSLIYTATGADSSITQLRVSGSMQTRRNLADLTVNSTITDVTWDTSCSCSPISGSITETIVNNSTSEERSRTISYPSCGVIQIGDSQRNLDSCD